MAAANIDLNALPSTVECSATEFRINLLGPSCSLVNVGVEPIFLKFDASGDIARDGLQHDGEIQVAPNDSVPLAKSVTFVRHQCAAGKVSKLWYVPHEG